MAMMFWRTSSLLNLVVGAGLGRMLLQITLALGNWSVIRTNKRLMSYAVSSQFRSKSFVPQCTRITLLFSNSRILFLLMRLARSKHVIPGNAITWVCRISSTYLQSESPITTVSIVYSRLMHLSASFDVE